MSDIPPIVPGSPDQGRQPAENSGQNLANKKVQSVALSMLGLISKIGTIDSSRETGKTSIKRTFLAAIEKGNIELIGYLFPQAQEFLGLALKAAAKKGDLGILRTLLRKGEISRESRGEAVVTAARFGNLDILKELLGNGDITAVYRGLAVRAAAEVGDLDIIKELLKKGNISEENRGWAFLSASEHGYLNIIKELLARGEILAEFTDRALVAAAEVGNLDIIKEVVKNVHTTDESRGNLLVAAVRLEILPIIEALLARGGIPPKFTEGALYSAVRLRNLPIIEALLEKGRITDRSCGNALLYAARIENLPIIVALLEKGLITEEFCGAALLYAAQRENLPIIEALLEKGRITDRSCGNILIEAAQIGNPSIVEALLRKGNISLEDRGAAFLVASRYGNVPLLRIFLNHNLDRVFIRAAANEAFGNGNNRTLEFLLRQLPFDDIVVAGLAQRLLDIAQQNAQQSPNTVDVHEDSRDLKAKQALILLWDVEKSFTPVQIQTNFEAFEDYLRKLPETDKNQKAKIALYGPKPQNSLFPPLLDGKFSLMNFALTGKELIARIWSYIMNQQKNPREQEICKNSMVSALKDSVDKDGALVCNQGKTHRLLIYVLQGRLEGVNIENVELPPTAQQALSFFFKVEKRQKINKWDKLKDEAEAFLRENPAVNRDTFMSELSEYFKNTFVETSDE